MPPQLPWAGGRPWGSAGEARLSPGLLPSCSRGAGLPAEAGQGWTPAAAARLRTRRTAFPGGAQRPLRRTFRFLACVLKGERGPASGTQAGDEDTLGGDGDGPAAGHLPQGEASLVPSSKRGPQAEGPGGSQEPWGWSLISARQ